MKNEVNPVVVWVLLGVVVVVVLIVGYRMLGPKGTKFQTTGSEDLMKKVQSGQPLYTTPPGLTGPAAMNTRPSGTMGTPPQMGGSK